MPNYVPGHGPTQADLMIVMEAPGKEEDKQGLPAVGAAGNLTNEMLQKAGTHRSNVYVTNVFKYHPPDNDLKLAHLTGHTIEEGIPQLWQEIQAINPKAILALGDLSLRTLTTKSGITKYRGSILQSKLGLPKVIPSLHPAGLLYSGEKKRLQYSARTYIQLDFNRAVEESLFPELRLPQRNLEIARNEYQVYQFFDRYKDKLEVAVDIETPKQIPFCISFAFNSHHAISIPLLNVFGLEIPRNQLVGIWQMVAKFLAREDIKIIGQNFKFDQEKLASVGLIINSPLYIDTTFLAHSLHPELPQRLEFLTSVYTREPYYKDEGKEWFDPGKKKYGGVDQLMTYNARDAAVTFECYEKMYPWIEKWGLTDHFHNMVMPLHEIYLDIEKEGFAYDQEERQALWVKYDVLAAQERDRLFDIAGHEFNYRSNPQLRRVVFEELGFPLRENLKDETIVALLANHAKSQEKQQFLDSLLNVRRYEKTKETYLEASPDFDERYRSSFRPCGTETGRGTANKLGPPLRPHVYLGDKIRDIGLPFHNLTKHGDIGSDVRKMLVVDEGTCFIEADLSQAEPRIVAVLSKDWDLLEKFEKKIDVHKWTSALCFDMEEKNVTADIRYVGKQCRNGGNYDMGKHVLMVTVNKGAKRFGIDINISEWKAGKILDRFHEFTPNIRGVFHKEVQLALSQNNLVLIAPSGSRRVFMGRGEEIFKEAYAHMGQRTVRDRMIEVMKALRKRGVTEYAPIVSENHDALVLRSPIQRKDDVAAILQEEFERPINFSKCSLPREYELKIPTEIVISYRSYYSKDFMKWTPGKDEREMAA